MLLTKKIDVPLCRMKLFYFGARLEDNFKIHDYDICDGDNMRLMMSFFAMGKDGCLEEFCSDLEGTAQTPLVATGAARGKGWVDGDRERAGCGGQSMRPP